MATAPITGYECGERLCKALGLDPQKTRRIVIDCAVDNVVVAYVERAVTADEMAEVEAAVSGREILVKPLAVDHANANPTAKLTRIMEGNGAEFSDDTYANIPAGFVAQRVISMLDEIHGESRPPRWRICQEKHAHLDGYGAIVSQGQTREQFDYAIQLLAGAGHRKKADSVSEEDCRRAAYEKLKRYAKGEDIGELTLHDLRYFGADYESLALQRTLDAMEKDWWKDFNFGPEPAKAASLDDALTQASTDAFKKVVAQYTGEQVPECLRDVGVKTMEFHDANPHSRWLAVREVLAAEVRRRMLVDGEAFLQDGQLVSAGEMTPAEAEATIPPDEPAASDSNWADQQAEFFKRTNH